MQECAIPRLLISAPSSSSGKTTVVCALLKLLPDAAAIKCGPDFIDPLFHRTVLNRQTGNVDLFFSTESQARAIFAHDVALSRIAICEGAMGYYDGVMALGAGEGSAPAPSAQASAYETARALKCPVVLVVDVRGKSLSVCAEINGFTRFREQNGDKSGICAVILNRCSRSLYETLAPQIRAECGLPVLGFLEQNPAFELPSRHLGLVTPNAVDNLRQKLDVLSEAAAKTLDLEALSALAHTAPAFSYQAFEAQFGAGDEKKEAALAVDAKKPRIAYACDEAFCFYYRENLDALCALGAELVPFSPLRDKLLPAGCQALYIGGGYPELFPMQLAENTTLLQSVRAFCRSGAPVFAECGGFLYLQLAGVLPGTFSNTGHLVRFGYITLTAAENSFLCRAGEQIRAHEFHYFDTTANGSSFAAQKPSGKTWACMVNTAAVPEMPAHGCHAAAPQEPNIVAGFPHLYFCSNLAFARNFVAAARAFGEKKQTARCSGCGGCSSRKGTSGSCATCSGCKACGGCNKMS